MHYHHVINIDLLKKKSLVFKNYILLFSNQHFQIHSNQYRDEPMIMLIDYENLLEYYQNLKIKIQ
jgi:hypothetical protein